jgi:hypothetical protein
MSVVIWKLVASVEISSIFVICLSPFLICALVYTLINTTDGLKKHICRSELTMEGHHTILLAMSDHLL